jgi:Major Facilitator Superfamily
MLKIFKHLLPLFIVQFFTWLALFALWIYATPVITRYVFKSVEADSVDFEKGVTWVGICFAFYATLAAFFTFAIPVIIKRIPKQKFHALALLAGSFGMLLLFFIKEKYLLLLSFSFIGIAWASIGNVPYSVISNVAPAERVTQYFAVFNFSVVIPQVSAAFLLSYINRNFFAGESIYIMLLASGCLFIAAVLMLLTTKKLFNSD